MTKAKKSILILLCILGGLSLFTIAFILIRSFSVSACEWLTRNISQYIILCIGHISSLFPFSLFEAVVITAIVILCVYLIIGIILFCKRQGGFVVSGFLVLCIVALFLANVYILGCGFAYNRESVDLPQTQENPSYTQLLDIAKYYKTDFAYVSSLQQRDEKGLVISPYSFEELAEIITKEGESKLSDYFYAYTPRIKQLRSLAEMYTSMTITGITFALTAEANVNTLIPPSSIPATTAHEMAHSKGVMRENEANLVAAYLLLSSDDEYLRYCGYYEFYHYIYIAALYNADSEAIETLAVPNEVSIEYAYDVSFWQSQSSIIDKISSFFNDLHLKLSGVQDGTSSYVQGTDGTTTDIINPNTQAPVIEVHYNSFQRLMIQLYYDKTEA